MAGTYQRQDQARLKYLYTSDNGTGYYIEMQPKYAQVSGLTAISGTPNVPKYPFSSKNLRHIYIRTTEQAPTAGRSHSRRVPCVRFLANQHPNASTPIDGLTGWTFGKVIGEHYPA